MYCKKESRLLKGTMDSSINTYFPGTKAAWKFLLHMLKKDYNLKSVFPSGHDLLSEKCKQDSKASNRHRGIRVALYVPLLLIKLVLQ